MKLFKIYAGKKTGKGSRDKDGFSSNGSFYSYLAESEDDAKRKFKKKNRNYNIYDVSKGR